MLSRRRCCNRLAATGSRSALSTEPSRDRFSDPGDSCRHALAQYPAAGRWHAGRRVLPSSRPCGPVSARPGTVSRNASLLTEQSAPLALSSAPLPLVVPPRTRASLMSTGRVTALLSIVLLASVSTLGRAQGVTTGAVAGIATDNQGAPVANATVIAVH